MKLPPFAFTRAESLDHALDVLGEHGGEAKALAGGQSLIPLMAFRLAAPSHLVDVSELSELRYVLPGETGLAVGGTTRSAELETAASGLAPHWAAFAEALPLVGHLPIRTRGTVAGSIAHADPTAELPLLACTFDAVIVAQSRDGPRELPAAEFFRGTMTTALEPTELIVEIRFPDPPGGTISVFEEFAERAGDFALASVCVAAACDEAGAAPGSGSDWAQSHRPPSAPQPPRPRTSARGSTRPPAMAPAQHWPRRSAPAADCTSPRSTAPS